MRILVFSIAVALVASLSYLYFRTERIQTIERLASNCNKIKLGMYKQEVINILGEPKFREIDTLYGHIFEDWHFKIPSGSSEPLNCMFDAKTGTLVEKTCMESGFAKFDLEFLAEIGYDSIITILKNLKTLSTGTKGDSIKNLLGTEFEETIFDDSVILQYPQKWLGFQKPVIILDSKTMSVVRLDVGNDKFVIH